MKFAPSYIDKEALTYFAEHGRHLMPFVEMRVRETEGTRLVLLRPSGDDMSREALDELRTVCQRHEGVFQITLILDALVRLEMQDSEIQTPAVVVYEESLTDIRTAALLYQDVDDTEIRITQFVTDLPSLVLIPGLEGGPLLQRTVH